MPTTHHHLAELGWRLLLFVVAASAVALAGWGSARLGPAHDEPASITAGYVYWRAGAAMEAAGRPPLGLMLESLGLWVTWGESVTDWPGLEEGNLDRLTAHVLSGRVPVMRMLWWGRIPGLLAMFLTALVIHRAAHRLWQSHPAALLAVATYCLLPSTLTHASRADGALLAGLWVTASALMGWLWMRREAGGWTVLACTLAGLLTDWSLWILVPCALPIVVGRLFHGVFGERHPPRHATPSEPPRHWAGRMAKTLLRRSRLPLGRILLGALIFWLIMVELTGDWLLWAHLWQSAVRHWTAGRGLPLPLFFHGNFYHESPLLYHPAVLLLKTPLWLPLLWITALASREVWEDRLRRWALIYLHAALLAALIAGVLWFPPGGYRPWVPFLPLVCILAGGALGSRRMLPGLSARVMMWRHAAVAMSLIAGLSVALFAMPHWHSHWNALAWVTGGGRAWFAAPENDAGPALPEAATHLHEAGLADELLFVAHQGRWSPEQLGLRCLFLPSQGLILEPTFRFNIENPPEGRYLIAASLLAGQGCLYPNTYRWFREHDAEHWFGGTIGLWEVTTPSLASPESD